MHRIDLTPVYVLHTRPFRNTSCIADLFSEKFGIVSVVARSARGPKSRYQGQLQLFTPMLASWFGQHELKTLGDVELSGMPIQLNQTPLFCGFYFNELLIRLLHKEDPHQQLFHIYHHSLYRLEKGDPIPVILRLFEKKLLDELGYGLPLRYEANSRTPIQANHFYYYEKSQGFLPCADDDHGDQTVFSGKALLSISAETLDDDATLAAAKRLMRMALASVLGNKPLNSRVFF